jgi:PKHD-type hydroxylase
MSWYFHNDKMRPWAQIENCLTEEECSNIIEMYRDKCIYDGKIDDHSNKNLKIRNSKVCLTSPEDMPYVYSKISNYVLDINNMFYNFDLWGFAENLQFSHYKEPDGKYEEHVDVTFSNIIRKLSIVVQLSKENDYEGGELELIYGENKIMSKKVGTLLAFPSFILHRVKPVSKGERFTLVGWVTGSSFR